MVKPFYRNKWLNRIPIENPWISSLIASWIGSAVLVVLGFILFLFSGGVPGEFIYNLPVHGIQRLCRNVRYLLRSMHAGIFITNWPDNPRFPSMRKS